MLEEFIQNTNLPLKKPFLKLAFENFEISYEAPNRMLSFLSLMISLEVLFNQGPGGVKQKISRAGAVLLGKDKNQSKDIYGEVKKLYKKRSSLVHRG